MKHQKPPYDYTFASFYDLENNAQSVVDKMIENKTKIKEENITTFNNKIKQIKDLYENKHVMENRIKYGLLIELSKSW